MLYYKALHIIFVVTWFAGLFYFVRLLVYHAEANQKLEPERTILINHFKGAERRLWYGITWPSAILTWLFGLLLATDVYGTDFPQWLWIKISFVIGLTIYHYWCGKILKQFAGDKIKWTGTQLRIFNEVASLFLVAIVFIVILKSQLEWIKGLVGFILFGLLLMLSIRLYKLIREKGDKEDKEDKC